MGDEKTVLDHRGIFLLGVLAECGFGRIIGTGRFPRGCDDTQARALVLEGYAVGSAHLSPNGHEGFTYEITRKGMNAWNAYRFTS